MKVKTAELIGAALDWAVARAERGDTITADWHPYAWDRGGQLELRPTPYSPSTDGSQAVPIIDRERIDIRHRPTPWCDVEATCRLGSPINAFGPTSLTAAMRCFVASRLGDEIEVPDELMACWNREADVSRDQADAHRPRSRA